MNISLSLSRFWRIKTSHLRMCSSLSTWTLHTLQAIWSPDLLEKFPFKSNILVLRENLTVLIFKEYDFIFIFGQLRCFGWMIIDWKVLISWHYAGKKRDAESVEDLSSNSVFSSQNFILVNKCLTQIFIHSKIAKEWIDAIFLWKDYCKIK